MADLYPQHQASLTSQQSLDARDQLRDVERHTQITGQRPTPLKRWSRLEQPLWRQELPGLTTQQ
jgi:hypothetical protein